MPTLTPDRPKVARIRDRESSPPPAASVKLPVDVVESARIIAAFRGEAVQDLLANILRPILAKMEREEIAKRTKDRS